MVNNTDWKDELLEEGEQRLKPLLISHLQSRSIPIYTLPHSHGIIVLQIATRKQWTSSPVETSSIAVETSRSTSKVRQTNKVHLLSVHDSAWSMIYIGKQSFFATPSGKKKSNQVLRIDLNMQGKKLLKRELWKDEHGNLCHIWWSARSKMSLWALKRFSLRKMSFSIFRKTKVVSIIFKLR